MPVGRGGGSGEDRSLKIWSGLEDRGGINQLIEGANEVAVVVLQPFYGVGEVGRVVGNGEGLIVVDRIVEIDL